MVIAWNPRNLIGISYYSAEEIATFNQLANFTFHTTLMKVKVHAETWLQHGVIFAPGPLYGFRNESVKQFRLNMASCMEYNLVTVYQLLGITDQKWTPDRFQKMLEEQLKILKWWPSEDYEIRTSVTAPDFNHLHVEALSISTPRRCGRESRGTFLEGRGQEHSAGACLHLFRVRASLLGYAGLMLDNDQKPATREVSLPDKQQPYRERFDRAHH